MKILVTGGAGFIGSNIVDAYVLQGHDVVVIDDLSTGLKDNVNPKAKFYKLDICDKKINEIFKKEKPEIISHHAAQRDVGFSIINPLEDARINILGSLNIIQNSLNCAKKIIYANSGGALYGNVLTKDLPVKETQKIKPVNQYGLNKSLIEPYLKMYSREYGLDFTSLRYANVYGERQGIGGEGGVVSIFIKKILKNEKPFIFGNGLQTRDFIYIKDAVKANLLSLYKLKNNIYNIGTGKQTSILQLYKLIAKELGFKEKPIYKPAMPREVKFISLSYEKAKKQMKWQPRYSLQQGIKNTINYFKNIKEEKNAT